MKKQSLRIIGLLGIFTLVCAIIMTVFFVKEKKEKDENVVIANAENYVDDKNAVHSHIIIPIDGKFSFADSNGVRTTSELYDVLSLASNGMYYFKQDTKQGFLNDGLQLVFSTSDVIDTNVSEKFVIYSKTEADGVIKKGFINITTGEKIEAVYDSVQAFSEGLAAVSKDKAIGFIDTDGNLVIPCTYSNKALYAFKSGFCNVMTGSKEEGNLKSFYIDKSGNNVFGKEFDFCMPFSEERAFVCDNGVWYVIDATGKRVGSNTFGPYENNTPTLFCNGYAVVLKNGRYGIIDSNGEYVVKPTFELINSLTNEGAIYYENGLAGFMSVDGTSIIPPKYEKLLTVKNGRVVFSKDQKYGVADYNGNYLIKPEYEKIILLENGLTRVTINNNECIYFNGLGQIIFDSTAKKTAG